MRIVHLKTNHLTDPIGFSIDRPVFSWQVEEARGTRQKSARIRVAADRAMTRILADTGWCETLDSLASPVDLDLSPRTRYYWTVAVETDTGETAESAVQFFETGKMDEPWTGRWITCRQAARHPIFHRDISPQKELAAARLYICGLGLYEAEIDGVRVGGEYMTPYCNNYAAWLQAQTYDVTEQLRRGGRLSVTLGHGWYMGKFGYFCRERIYGSEQMLLAEVHLRYTDGTEEAVGTGEDWWVTRSTITFSNIYDGEHRDDTLPAAAAEPVRPAEQRVPVVDRFSLPVTVHERVRPVALLHTPRGETVLDLGQNLVGIFSLRLRGRPGMEVRLQMGEVLQEGCFYNENLRNAKAEYRYTCAGGEIVLEPKFTFYGFRYVKVEGVPDLQPEDFTALVLYSDLPETGTLATGNEKVNRLIQNVKWGQKGNFLDVPTDCPQRDERMGWTGDAQVFAPTACYLRDSYAFFRKYLHDMHTEQAALEGMVPDVIPSFSREYQGTSSVWGDAAVLIPWDLYLFYGDRSILEESFAGMRAWVDYIRRYDGDNHAWRTHFHYGDWLALDHPSGAADECRGGTDEGYIAYVYYRNSASIVSKAADILGKEAEAEEYAALAAELERFIREEYFAPGGRCVADTQTGLLLALEHGLSPRPDACRARLRQKLQMAGNKLQTGFVGTPFLLDQLTESGMAREAYDLLLYEGYPGWLYAVNLGATTIWERWNSLSPDGTVSSTGMNSFNHYAYGSIAGWMFRHMAGLQPLQEAPGFRRVKLAPVPDSRIGTLEMRLRAAAGSYRVAWELGDRDAIRLEIEVPFGCQALLTLPYAPPDLAGERLLEPGRHSFAYSAVGMRPTFSLESTAEEILAYPPALAAVEALIPGIGRLPYAMRQTSLRELFAQRGIPATVAAQVREALTALT